MAIELNESRRWCHRFARKTAGNFYYSFLTLPRAKLIDMCVLYAFMRITDDCGDDPALGLEERRWKLREWRRSTERLLEGQPGDHPCHAALRDLIERREIPPHLFGEVIDGVQLDLDPQQPERFEQLETYCYHVAGAVGLCCIHVWGFEGAEAYDRAIDCGLAFQLTNILRDLREDALAGRVYLPAEDFRRFGYTIEQLRSGEYSAEFVELMRFQVERAREYYDRAVGLRRCLTPAGARIYAAMTRIYGSLLTEIERRDYDIFSERIRLPRWKKLWISMGAMLRIPGA